MLFSSITFLYVFLPLVLLVYFVMPRRLKNSVLLFASLLFYAWGEPKYVILMIGSILLGYIFGLLIEHYRGTAKAKLFLILSVSINVLALGIFKYADFFISSFGAATGISVQLLGLALPIGISFYTFQILSYTVDVYRGNARAQKNILHLGTYIAMFPQLIAGPIVRYTEIEARLGNRTHSFDSISQGARRFILGLSKKVLIANQLGELCEIFRASGDKSVLFFWLYALASILHIYFDFSGYSDMAIGLGKIFGFDFVENFQYPYISASITEFWRRWHISLGNWFRDYVYIPLGGNRVSKLRWVRNIWIVWLLTGFWHGAAWNFVAWGAFFAILLLLEKWFLKPYLEKAKVWNHIYVILMSMISFVIFGADTLADAGHYIISMFGAGGYPLLSAECTYYFWSYLLILVIACVGATPLPKQLYATCCKTERGQRICNVLEVILLPILLLVVTAFLVDGSFNPFLYFRF